MAPEPRAAGPGHPPEPHRHPSTRAARAPCPGRAPRAPEADPGPPRKSCRSAAPPALPRRPPRRARAHSLVLGRQVVEDVGDRDGREGQHEDPGGRGGTHRRRRAARRSAHPARRPAPASGGARAPRPCPPGRPAPRPQQRPLGAPPAAAAVQSRGGGGGRSPGARGSAASGGGGRGDSPCPGQVSPQEGARSAGRRRPGVAEGLGTAGALVVDGAERLRAGRGAGRRRGWSQARGCQRAKGPRDRPRAGPWGQGPEGRAG